MVNCSVLQTHFTVSFILMLQREASFDRFLKFGIFKAVMFQIYHVPNNLRGTCFRNPHSFDLDVSPVLCVNLSSLWTVPTVLVACSLKGLSQKSVTAGSHGSPGFALCSSITQKSYISFFVRAIFRKKQNFGCCVRPKLIFKGRIRTMKNISHLLTWL